MSAMGAIGAYSACTAEAAALRAAAVWLTETKETDRGARMSSAATSPTFRLIWPGMIGAARMTKRASASSAPTISALAGAPWPDAPSGCARVRGMKAL